MLPLCFGEATKVCAYLLNADKRYRVVAKLGTAMDTGDGDGVPTLTKAVPDLGLGEWRDALDRFVGDIEQVPADVFRAEERRQAALRTRAQG